MAENLAALDNNGLSDPYCIISNSQNTVLARTRVIYESLNPRWDEAFDLTIDSDDQNWLTLTIWDSDQVSSDDECGQTHFKLNPRDYDDYLAHDVWLDISPQGRILLRVSMEGEKDDLQFYFGKTFRTLKRAHDDMARTIVDRMSPFLRQCLSREVINKLLRPSTGAFKKFFRETDVQAKKSEIEMEQAIYPLFDYFDINLKTLFRSLHPVVFTMVMTRVWKEIETIIEEILIPPLSDKPSDLKPLNDEELEVVYKWLKFLSDYLHANGNGVSKEEVLFNPKYHEMMRIQYFYVMDTESLKEEYRIIILSNPPKKNLGASKSVLHQRNLGTIKHRKSEKRKHSQFDEGEIILRILRMHPGTKAFLKEQMEERAKKIQSMIAPVKEGGVGTTAEN